MEITKSNLRTTARKSCGFTVADSNNRVIFTSRKTILDPPQWLGDVFTIRVGKEYTLRFYWEKTTTEQKEVVLKASLDNFTSPDKEWSITIAGVQFEVRVSASCPTYKKCMQIREVDCQLSDNVEK